METFKDSGLHPQIIKGVEALGFNEPTPIQKMSIEHLLGENTDLIAFAQTGTGKTAAFSLPILHQLEEDVPHVQAIILAPTRELCLQISKDIEDYSKFMPVKVCAVYGGAPITKQIKELQGKPQIVVGTPGRTLDLIDRKKLRIDDVQFLVLDEADEMLSMGFQDELDAILANTPEHKQTLCFSATMPDGMKKLTNKYLNDPKEISAGKRNISASNVSHELYTVSAKHTYEAMRRIMDFNPNMYGIVFCRTRRETQSIAEQLINDGYRAEALHGDLSQAQRDEVMNRFRKKNLNVMVATDVAARGIDVTELTHVINVNIPDDPEVYVHRSGRTGRAGSSGISIVITHGRNMRKVKTLERIIGKEFESKLVPSGESICQVKIGQAIDELVDFEYGNELDPQILEQAMDKLAHLSKADLIERFLGHETSLILSRYRGARDINEQPKKFKESSPRRESGGGSEAGFKTVVVDLGYRQNVNPSRLMGLINDSMEGKKIRVGKIDMDKTFTRIDIEERYAVDVALNLNGAKTGSYVVNAYFEEGSGSSAPSFDRPRRSNSGAPARGKRERMGDRRDSNQGGRGRREDRGSSFERKDNNGRFERTNRFERNDRTERSDRGERPERSEGGFRARTSDSKPRFERGGDSGFRRGGDFKGPKRSGGSDSRGHRGSSAKPGPKRNKRY